MGDFTQQLGESGHRGMEYLEWQTEYMDAIMETDPVKLREKIHRAEYALFRRSQSPERSIGDAERQAMANAASALRVLMVEVLGYPDSRK
jgi:hypothetical protein